MKHWGQRQGLPQRWSCSPDSGAHASAARPPARRPAGLPLPCLPRHQALPVLPASSHPRRSASHTRHPCCSGHQPRPVPRLPGRPRSAARRLRRLQRGQARAAGPPLPGLPGLPAVEWRPALIPLLLVLRQRSAACLPHARTYPCRPPPAPLRSEPPICLTGGLNVDDCAAGTDPCWRGAGESGAALSACVDTFRGFVCRCPPGAGWGPWGRAPQPGRRVRSGRQGVASAQPPDRTVRRSLRPSRLGGRRAAMCRH